MEMPAPLKASTTTTKTKMADDGDALILESHSHATEMMVGMNNLRLEGEFLFRVGQFLGC